MWAMKVAGDALFGFLGELLVLVCGDGCLVHPGGSVGVEGPQPGAVGFAAALRGQAIRRLQQPERRPDALRAAGEAE